MSVRGISPNMARIEHFQQYPRPFAAYERPLRRMRDTDSKSGVLVLQYRGFESLPFRQF